MSSMDLEQSLHAVSERVPQSDAFYAKLAAEFSVHILTPSAPVFDTDVHPDRPVNRTRLIAPNGKSAVQDKQIMTVFERDPWDVATGSRPLKLFDTSLGKIGVLICYDSEFPLLGRALIEAGAAYILVPSCTEALGWLLACAYRSDLTRAGGTMRDRNGVGCWQRGLVKKR